MLEPNPQTGEPRGSLAKSWEYSADGLTLTLHLEQGVKWHNRPPVNGREFDAQDVVASIDRIRNGGATFLRKSNFALVTKVEAVDKYTVRFSLSQVFAPFLVFLATGSNVIYPREAIQQFPDMKDLSRNIGTGPMLFDHYTPGVGGSVVKSPTYRVPGKPYLDKVDVVIVGDQATLLSALRTGKVDYGPLTVGDLDETGKQNLQRTNPSLRFVSIPKQSPQMLTWPLSQPPYNDIRFRKAVNLIVDRNEVIQAAVGGAGRISGPMNWMMFPEWTFTEEELSKMPGYRKDKTEDLKEAKRLLAEAGYDKGLTLEAEGTEYFAWGNLIPLQVAQSQLAPFGIKINITMFDQATYFASEVARKFSMRARGHSAAQEPDDQLYTRHHSKGGRNYQGYNNPKVDALLDQQRSLLDPAKRKPLILEAQRILMDEVPQVWMFFGVTYLPVQPWVKNFTPTAWGIDPGWDSIWVEK